MKPRSLSFCHKLVLCSLALATALACASDVVLQKAPPLTIKEAPNYPENVARYHFGADVHVVPQTAATTPLVLSSAAEDNNRSIAALLSDDPTTGYQLSAGATTLLVSLSNIETIQNISFLNENAEGDCTVAVSNADVTETSPQWHTAGETSLKNGPVTISVGPGEAKYLKLSFNISRPGRLASFGVYAMPAISDFTMPRPRKVSFENPSPVFALINHNFTDVHTKARCLYASSGNLGQVSNMIDDQSATGFQFAQNDPSPTAIIDLGRERTLGRIAAVYAAQPGSVDFYVLDHLPLAADDSALSNIQPVSNSGQVSDLPSTLKISEKEIASIKAVGSVVNTAEGRAAVDFPAIKGRYLMLKWHPASAGSQPFTVAQVAAFGVARKPTPAPNAENAPQVGPTENEEVEPVDGKEFGDAKSILDNKDVPAEAPIGEGPIGEGPAPGLPGVPPFTFIPQVPPVVAPISP